ncbi:hypothetical protein BY996DRAFT_6571123 [Phakopsora pachyrhizi]|nr:hypothetical protein BY996DRAFT_6571123 [Phakopsora pachyrhizi]
MINIDHRIGKRRRHQTARLCSSACWVSSNTEGEIADIMVRSFNRVLGLQEAAVVPVLAVE